MNIDTSKKHGGPRNNAGRKLETPGASATKRSVTLDEMTVRKLIVLGDGNVSKGIRAAANTAYDVYQRQP